LRAVSYHPFSALAVALALSSLGLLGGPLILSLGRGRAVTAALTEGLTLGLVPTMVVLRLLPHVAEQLGPWAVALTCSAFLVLRWFDRAHHRAAARVGRSFIYAALVLHSFTDGVGLAAAVAASAQPHAMDLTLTLAFVVHRLPEGLFIATTLLPTYGPRRTLMRIFGLAGATLAGGTLGGALLTRLPERLFDAVVALGLGAMLQLVVHSHADRATRPSTRALSSLALFVGVAIAVVVPTPHDLLRTASPRELNMFQSLVPLFVETAPALGVALLLGALPRVWPARAPIGAAARGQARAILAGLYLGARLPLGPTAAIPAARGLLAEGAPLGAAVAFVLTSATLGLDGLLLSIVLLGVSWSVARFCAALLLALAGAVLVGGPAASRAPLPARDGARAATPLGALASALGALDQRGAWYVLGLVAASALESALPSGALAGTGGTAAAIALIVLTLPLHVALLALIPTTTVLMHKGMSPGAALALALAAPAFHADAIRLVAGAAGWTRAAALIGVTVLLALGVGIGLGCWIDPGSVPRLHDVLARTPSVAQVGVAALLALGLLAGLLRLGPGLWLGQLGLVGEAAEHDHAH
jgi:uncharacterized membrane protein YraQ (UPF0718 family)